MQAGRAEVREVMARAGERRRGGRGTVFFLDEIHRFNKAQQDALLPAVEDGTVVLIGATTENPYFEVNSALHLPHAHLRAARADRRRRRDAAARGRSPERRCAATTSLDFLAARSGGDARTALNALELAARHARGDGAADDRADAEDALQRKAVLYDRAGDKHYDYISAWIKSTRGLGPGRVAVLPRGDARGRRGPALHRPPHDHPRLRGRRQRRPAGAAGRGRRGGRGRARRHARGPLRARAVRDLPGARAEVRRRRPGAARRARARARARRRGPARPRCAPPPTPLPRRSAGAWATTTRTATRPTSTTRSTCPRGSRTCASTRPTRPRPELRDRLARIRKAPRARRVRLRHSRSDLHAQLRRPAAVIEEVRRRVQPHLRPAPPDRASACASPPLGPGGRRAAARRPRRRVLGARRPAAARLRPVAPAGRVRARADRRSRDARGHRGASTSSRTPRSTRSSSTSG